MEKKTLTIREAMTVTGLSRSTFYNLFKSGDLTPIKAGRRTLLLATELNDYLYSLPRGVMKAA
jgi:excisionase family DNA binding protein